MNKTQELGAKFIQSLSNEEYIKRMEKVTAITKSPLYTQPPKNYKDSFNFGWMRGIAMEVETLLHGRWFAWLKINAKGEFTKVDVIPEIKFDMNARTEREVTKMLEKCMHIVRNDGYQMYEFIEWIGYSLGIALFKKPPFSERAWEQLYETFSLDLMLYYPADHLSQFVAENGQGGSLDYYPTPFQVTDAITRMLNADNDDFTAHKISTHEPCLGAAAMYLSSKSLMLSGGDLSPFMCKVASIQAFCWLPWLLYTPTPIVGLHLSKEEMRVNNYFEFDTNTRIYCGDALIGELQAPKEIFKEDSEIVDIHLNPLDLKKREIFKYEEELEQIMENWSNASKEERFRVVRAQARELPFGNIVTNPPFNSKVGKWYREQTEAIEKSNMEFIKQREERLKNKKVSILEPQLKQIQKEVEKKIQVTKETKNVAEGQYEFQLFG
ncbi:hypothetical protein QTG56_24655 (plasmid) [Rossellomorea sp. AcN35-11]|nr:hypothetical protein [Rossellomorea aquimaris]WJV31827.1 hypothetical protein QTG56_24655 [Rossellomorea sp. AcN35-11]